VLARPHHRDAAARLVGNAEGEAVRLPAPRGQPVHVLDVHALLRLEVIGEQPRELPQRADSVGVLDDQLRAGLGRPRQQRQVLAVRAARVALEAPPVAVGALDREGARPLRPHARRLEPGRRARRAALLARHARQSGRGSERDREACHGVDAHAGTVAIARAARNRASVCPAPLSRARFG